MKHEAKTGRSRTGTDCEMRDVKTGFTEMSEAPGDEE
jgi:hypothetical protein